MIVSLQNAAVPKLDLVPGGGPTSPAEGFETAFADDPGEQRLPLLETWHVALESYLRVRSSPPTRVSATTRASGGPP